jgi:hypothetical protein
VAARTYYARCFTVWPLALLAGLLMAVPGSRAITAETPGTAQPHWVGAPAAFSDLAEVTPANVQGLLALVAPAAPLVAPDEELPSGERAALQGLRIDSSADVDRRVRRFVEERAPGAVLTTRDAARPQLRGCVISYVVADGQASAALAPRELRAWDPNERRVLWSVREALPISSRSLVTAGGLVFYGTSDGWLKALDAGTGRLLWQHKVDDSTLGEPISYRGADGHQYIAVRTLPGFAGADGGGLVVFALAH